jgi:hypothetical protein
MSETTRAIAKLPSLDVDIIHDRSEEDGAERIAIRITGRPDLETAARFVEPQLMAGLMAMNPWLQLQSRMMEQMWRPWLAMNPLLRPLLPPPSRDD